MTPADLAKFEPQRRYATLVALALEGMATVTDEIIDLHDRIFGQTVQFREKQASAAVPGVGQGHQRQGALVRTRRPSLARRQAEWRRSIRRHRIRHLVGRFCRERHRGAESSPNQKTSTSCTASARATPHCAATHQQFLDVLELRAAPAAKGVLDRHRGAARQ